MAPRTERSEKELNQDINAAIAGTEDEIFSDALNEEMDLNDGDTDLEEMGEGLEGDDLEEDEEEAEEEEAEEEDEGEEDVEDDDDVQDEDEEVSEATSDEDEQPRDKRGRFERDEPRVPPSRLREANERARQAEAREQELLRRTEALEARFNADQQARLNAIAPQRNEPAPPVKPDQFAEPEKYEQWVLDRAEERATRRLQQEFAQRDQQQRDAFNARVNRSFDDAMAGEDGVFVRQAYFDLMGKLSPKNPQHQAIVQNIIYSQSPPAALLEWWNANGGEEFREKLTARLTGEDPPRRERGERRAQREDRYDDRQRGREVRHVTRRAQTMKSLNGASGGGSHRVADPDVLDGSESSVFDFATRK